MRSALEVADVFRRHGAAYRQTHAGHLSRGQRRVMAAIEACRTAALGGHVEQCADCGQVRIAYNSCRNRHCPKCQGLARAEWLADRQAELKMLVEYQQGPFAHYMPYTPYTEPTLQRLAALKPRTLATMHGSTFVGDGAQALTDLAQVMQEVLGGR